MIEHHMIEHHNPEYSRQIAENIMSAAYGKKADDWVYLDHWLFPYIDKHTEVISDCAGLERFIKLAIEVSLTCPLEDTAELLNCLILHNFVTLYFQSAHDEYSWTFAPFTVYRDGLIKKLKDPLYSNVTFDEFLMHERRLLGASLKKWRLKDVLSNFTTYGNDVPLNYVSFARQQVMAVRHKIRLYRHLAKSEIQNVSDNDLEAMGKLCVDDLTNNGSSKAIQSNDHDLQIDFDAIQKADLYRLLIAVHRLGFLKKDTKPASLAEIVRVINRSFNININYNKVTDKEKHTGQAVAVRFFDQFKQKYLNWLGGQE